MGKFESSDSELLRVYQFQMPSLRGGGVDAALGDAVDGLHASLAR